MISCCSSFRRWLQEAVSLLSEFSFPALVKLSAAEATPRLLNINRMPRLAVLSGIAPVVTRPQPHLLNAERLIDPTSLDMSFDTRFAHLRYLHIIQSKVRTLMVPASVEHLVINNAATLEKVCLPDADTVSRLLGVHISGHALTNSPREFTMDMNTPHLKRCTLHGTTIALSLHSLLLWCYL